MQKTKFYKLIPSDMEQMNVDTISNFLKEAKLGLNQTLLKDTISDFQQPHFLSKFLGLPLKDSDTNCYFYKFYSLNEVIYLETNYEEEIHLPNIKFLPVQNEGEINQIIIEDVEANGDAVLGEDFVSINGKYLRLINLYEFSKNLMPSSLMDYGDYCVFFKKIDPVVSKRRVNTQRKLHHSNLYSNLRNLESEASFMEAEKLSESMMEGEEIFFEVEAWFIVKADSLPSLNAKTKIIIRNLKQGEVTPHIEAEGLYELFPTILCNGVPKFKRAHQTPSSYLVNLLPLKHDELQSDGIEFISSRGNPIYFNLFDESALNFNLLLSGQSGAGKSMIAQKILVEELENDAKAIVLDLGNSFKKTAQYFGGMSLSLSFNPLQFKSPHYLKELIISVIPKAELNAKMEGKIFSIINDNINCVTSFKELIHFISNEISDFELYFSELWEFFDDKTRDLSAFTYVDTTLYPDKIKAPLIIFLIEAFNHLEGKRVFIFDEVWDFLTNNAEYIAECFRTFRKSGASAIAISQGIDDFSETQMGKVIAKLCSTKILFQQTIEASSEITSFDVERIRELSTKRKEYSEFYVKTEHHRKIARFYPTALEYELFTSNHNDRNSFDRFHGHYAEYFSFPEIMDRYVDFKYYFGGMSA